MKHFQRNSDDFPKKNEKSIQKDPSAGAIGFVSQQTYAMPGSSPAQIGDMAFLDTVFFVNEANLPPKCTLAPPGSKCQAAVWLRKVSFLVGNLRFDV